MGAMKFIDLFAGCGGMRLGLEQAGMKCVGFCEFDRFAVTSYRAIHNTEGEWYGNDIREIRGGDIPNADLWAFGFPCQDISVAGKGAGLNGERSGLFYEVVRLLREKGESKPEWLIAENVKNLLSIDRGRGFLEVLRCLDEAGYDVHWELLNSKDFGVPQSRERVFIVGRARDGSGREVFSVRDDGTLLKNKATGDTSRVQTEVRGAIASAVLTKPGSRPTDTFVTIRQVGQLHQTNYFGGNPQYGRIYSDEGLSPTLQTCQGGGLVPKIHVRAVVTPERKVKRQNGRRFKDVNEPMFTLTVQDRHGVDDGDRIRRLTPKECWRLQGFPDDYFDKAKAAGLSDTQLYKQAGNAVTVNVAKAVGVRIMQEVTMTEKELNAIKRIKHCVAREVWNASEVLYGLSFILEEHDTHHYQGAKMQELAERLYAIHKAMQIDWGDD